MPTTPGARSAGMHTPAAEPGRPTPDCTVRRDAPARPRAFRFGVSAGVQHCLMWQREQYDREVVRVDVLHYSSPLGGMLLAADETGLTGAWFDGASYFGAGLPDACRERETAVLAAARRWLDGYFSDQEPGALPPLHPRGTAFQLAVWRLVLKIPYGQTTSYGALARELARDRGLPGMSAQAIGGAVGRNPVSILIPCHRVVGSNGNLTGYSGGVEKKRFLLALEADGVQRLSVP